LSNIHPLLTSSTLRLSYSVQFSRNHLFSRIRVSIARCSQRTKLNELCGTISINRLNLATCPVRGFEKNLAVMGFLKRYCGAALAATSTNILRPLYQCNWYFKGIADFRCESTAKS
ncbi:hypothetical protein LLE49_02090, partial [Alicyclobacillus tolerans]|uniref:hypothetical protein n=1 Tax=Alicyclobacillus tolerans TaxID=90970 RepID=UPI001F307BC3